MRNRFLVLYHAGAVPGQNPWVVVDNSKPYFCVMGRYMTARKAAEACDKITKRPHHSEETRRKHR